MRTALLVTLTFILLLLGSVRASIVLVTVML